MPSLKTGERYFPEKVIKTMDPNQYAYETRKKRASLKKGEQFADWSEKTQDIKIPPIKNQGIKSKLVKFINENITWNEKGKWIEPFLGSGVVMFNIQPKKAIGSDTNIHIINFYKNIQSGNITSEKTRKYLESEGEILFKKGEDHFYDVRKRFNESGDSMDFLFLNRACFNGMMRFNSKGGFNVPFCRKPNRFSKSYITKITNQVKWLSELFQNNKWEFRVSDWRDVVKDAKSGDFLYLDPPYFGRHTNYYNRWDESDLKDLSDFLKKTKAKFGLSLWLENKYRKNEHIERLFSEFSIKTFEHFYHVGSSEDLRNSMTEALILNV